MLLLNNRLDNLEAEMSKQPFNTHKALRIAEVLEKTTDEIKGIINEKTYIYERKGTENS